MSDTQAHLQPNPARSVRPELAPPVPKIRRVGRIRLPLTLTHAPWATLYLLPDETRRWTVRLWEGEAAVRRCVSSATLLRFVRRSRLRATELEIVALLAAAGGDDGAESP